MELGAALLCALAEALGEGEDPSLGLRGALQAFLSQHRIAAVMLEGRTITVNRRFVEDTPEVGAKVATLHAALSDRGVGGLLLGGVWDNGSAGALAEAFEGAPAGPRTAIAKGLRQVPHPAMAMVLGPGDARLWPPDPGQSLLDLPARASFCQSRLMALAEATYAASRSGRSPDLYYDSVLRTLWDVVDHLEEGVFLRRLLSMPLLPDRGPAMHAANVAVLSLCMGNLLGLERTRLVDLGVAAFFHDLGRAEAPRTAGGESEDPTSAERHIVAGLRACLRGRHSRAAELRLAVIGEHHLRSDGYPTPLVEPHALTELVAVADAYDRLEQGTPWRSAISPAAALKELRSDPVRYAPEAVDLLVNVLGEHPRGSFLRTSAGSVLLVADGGAWRGQRPVARVLMNGDGTAAGRELVALEDPEGYQDDDADLSVLGFKPWKILLGKTPLELPPGEWPEEATGEEPTEEELEGLGLLLDSLLASIEQFALFPERHQKALQSVMFLYEALSEPLAGYPKLTLELSVRGVCVQGAVVRPSAEALPLLDALRPHGVTSLTFRRGVAMDELAVLARVLAGSLLEQEPQPLNALWAEKLRRVRLRSHDPHGPSAVEADSEPLESDLVASITDIFCGSPAGSPETDGFCEAIASAEESSEAAMAALPSMRGEYLASPEGSARTLFLERASQPFHLHALKVARRAERECSPDDIAGFQAAMIRRLLWEGSLDAALDAVEAIAGDGDLPPTLAKSLAEPGCLHLLVRRLREGDRDPDVGGGVAFLNYVGPRAVGVVCELYGGLGGEEELRRLLATYLVPHLRLDPSPLVPLTLNDDPQIAREALILMGVGGPTSQGGELLRRFAGELEDEDPIVVKRAKIAREVLAEAAGSDVRDQLLETIASGEDKVQRLAAIVELRTIANTAVLEGLGAYAKSKEFQVRDDDEIDAVLQTIAQIGGVRAMRIFEELARVNRFALGKGTRRIAKVAGSKLSDLREENQQEKTQRIYLKGVCARCKFENMPGAENCLQCNAPLASAKEASGKVASKLGTKRVRRPTVRLRRPEAKSDLPERGASGRIKRASLDAQNLAAAKRSSAKVEALAWLSYPLLPPVPMGAQPVVTIGRAPGCDLELVHESVSREHAIVRIAGEQMIIEDRSSYGTWVNGKRVMNTELKPGDVITVGPFDISIEPGKVGSDRLSDTRPLRTFASSEAIGGRLERVSLAEVLQQIEFNEKTGTLEVFTEDKQSGLLVIYKGKPMYAELTGLKDQDAVLKMLSLKRGNFSFRSKVEAGEMSMAGMTLTGLLMEASRQIDEASIPE